MAALLGVVGVSHRTASVEVRERMAFADEALAAALKQVVQLAGVGEAMIVSTCNRVEIYAGIDGEDAVAALKHYLIDGRALPTEFKAHVYGHAGEAAVRHLFRVAGSLDSMVVGESQILGQVKQAYALAEQHGTIGPVLGRSVPRAFSLAKQVRTETEVARSAASISSVAVDLASQIFGDLRGRNVLVVGAGKMGDLSARHLLASGIGSLRVINRTRARADELAARLGGQAADWDEFDALLGKVDIVLCSTGASEPVVHKERVERAMRVRRGRWLFFIDIAVPRDVDPQVGQIENVYLYDIDALAQVVETNRAGRMREADTAEALVEQALERFFAAELTVGVLPTIKLLRSHFASVAEAEATRVMGKLQSLSERDRAHIKQMADAIINKLLHAPLTALKREAQSNPNAEEVAALVRDLFDLHTGHTEKIHLASDGEPSTESTPAIASAFGRDGSPDR